MKEVKQAVRRFLALMLTMALVLPLMPQLSLTAQAAVSGTISGLVNTDIGAAYSGTDNGDYSSWSATGGNSILGSVISASGCSSTSYNTTLTLTNNKSTEAILSFDYEIEQNSGTVQVAGTAVTEGGSYSGTLSAGESVRIYIASGSTDAATTITITNLFLVTDVETTVTFRPSENGTYTVDGETITAQTIYTRQSTEAYSLSATADAGYKFLAWCNLSTGEYISSEKDMLLRLDTDQIISAVFVSEDTPIYNVGGVIFTDLNDADAYAVSRRIEKITLVSDGTLPAGEYTISEDVILLIPFDESGTCYTTAPATTGNSYSTPSCYCTLTMASGANITVNGGISVSAKHTAQGNGFNGQAGDGAPSGSYGYIYMEDGSSITINDNGGLYVYGYISGEGTVTAKSGADVYENMQIKDFRGGTLTANMAGNSQKVFPFNQYFVQNIEAELTLESGADEYIYTSLYATLTASTVVHFVGDGGLFEIADGSSFTKKYLPDEDIMEMSVDGDASINSLAITVATVTISSEDYVLPITNGMRLNVLSGTTSITQDIALLAGVEVTVNEGAALHVGSGSSVYVYDRDEWIANNYASNTTFKSVTYSPTRTYTRTQADLTDVTIDLNGTLIADGYVYTTEGGADIISSQGTGSFVMNGGAGTETVTYQAYNSTGPSYAEIAITSAKLHNGSSYTGTDEEYTLTEGAAAGSIYTYDASADMWKKEAAEQESYTVTWINDDGTVLETDEDVAYGTIPEYNGETPQKEGDVQYSYTFIGWTPEISEVTGDITYKAVYKQTVNTYTVTWKNWDGQTLMEESVAYGEVPSYSGDQPVRDSDGEHSYTFSGWTPEITAVTGDAEYTAVFTESVNTYTVTWADWDGTVLETDENIAYGTEPEYNGETPVREGDAQYSYTFSGWSPSPDTVTGDIIYTAVYTQTLNEYTITWINGDTILKEESVAYGETPVYSGETPVKEGDAQYSYTFTGWTPEITSVTGDAVYTAVFEQTVNTYTVTWVNADGTILETDEDVAYGTMPEYNGETPEKASDGEYTYTFSGWSPEITAVTGDVTYAAQFTATAIEKSEYTVTFDANGGEGTMEPQTFVQGVETRLNENTFTRDGYQFIGWNTAVDGSEISYADGAALIDLTEDITLYAQWQFWEGWLSDEYGKQYYQDGELQKTGWTLISEDWYYLDPDTGYAAADGLFWLPYPTGYGPDSWDMENNDDYSDYGYDTHSYFLFDSDGIFTDSMSGLYTLPSGTIVHSRTETSYVLEHDTEVWLTAGELTWHPGLVTDGNAYYYFPTDYFEDDSAETMIKGQDYYVSKSNDLSWPEEWGEGIFTEGTYSFDDDGKLLLRDGLTPVENATYYYVKGVKTYAGLIEIDGNYYYINSSCMMVADCEYTISKTNGLLPAGTYEFDETGKMIRKDESLNGIVIDDDGIWRYYVNGVKVYTGLIEIDGDYYYVNSNYEVIHDRNYFISKTNGLLDQGTYEFDAEGKLILPDQSLNGIVKGEDGTWYYYVDGVKVYAGLIEIDGDYYYVNSNYEVIHDCTYTISKTNGLLPQAAYEFDAEGKMVTVDQSLNGIVKQDDDTWYYYVNGVKTYAGLIEIGGDYYYVNSSFLVIHNQSYFISKTNGLLPNATYLFDEEGKLIQE